MILNLAKQFVSKAVLGVIGAVGLGTMPDSPLIVDGQGPEEVLWKAVLFGAAMGVLAVLKRRLNWDQGKANQGS